MVNFQTDRTKSRLTYWHLCTAKIMNYLLTVPKYQATEIPSRYMSHVMRKPVFGVSDQVRHNPASTAPGDG